MDTFNLMVRDMAEKLELPIEKLKKSTFEAIMPAHDIIFLIFNIPVNVSPLCDIIFFRIRVFSTFDAIQEYFLEFWDSEEGYRDTNLQITSKVRLDILTCEFYKTVIQSLMEELLV